MASGTVKATEVSGEKNIVAQIAKISWEKVKSAEKMAGAEKKYAKKKLRVGEEGGLTQEEFSRKYGRGSFFRKALGSQFGGDKIVWVYYWRTTKFFRVALFHNTLEGYYKTNFALMQHHKYSLTEIENLYPWERQVYVSLLLQYLDNLKQEQEKQKK